MPTRQRAGAIPDRMVEDAREKNPELSGVPVASLVRIGLLVLAGVPLAEAVRRSGEGLQSAGRPVRNRDA